MLGTRAGILPVIAAATLFQSGNGLMLALLPLRMQAEGLSATAIGSVATAYGLGFVTGSVAAPRLVRRVGHIRAFTALAALLAVVALGFSQAGGTAAWIALRALSGVCLAGLFTVVEAWINLRSLNATRGRAVSIYMVATKIALMLSPLSIGFGEIGGNGLFMLTAALFMLSLLPVTVAPNEAPAAPRTARLRLGYLYAVAPSAVIGCFASGLLSGPVVAMAPLYGVKVGLSAEMAAVLLVALQAGNLVLQWPLGWLSDRIDRRAVIAGVGVGAALASMAIAGLPASLGPLVLPLLFAAWGGCALCLYALSIAHGCDRVRPARMVTMISGLLSAWAAGAMIGPLPAAALMDFVGPSALFLYAAVIAGGMCAFVTIRMLQRGRPIGKDRRVRVEAVVARLADH
jgi:Arabinose efflux permease